MVLRPDEPGGQRFWDGERWTDERRTAPPPAWTLVAAVSWGLDPKGVGGHGEVASRNTAGSISMASMVASNSSESELGAWSRSSMWKR